MFYSAILSISHVCNVLPVNYISLYLCLILDNTAEYFFVLNINIPLYTESKVVEFIPVFENIIPRLIFEIMAVETTEFDDYLITIGDTLFLPHLTRRTWA